MAANALQLARGIASVINTEFKYVDTNAAPNMGSPITYTVLNLLAQGTGPSNRTGDSIRAVRLHFNCIVTGNAASTTCGARMMLFVVKQPGGGGAPSSPFPLVTASMPAMLQPEYASRVTVLQDRTFTIVKGGDSQVQILSLDIPLNLHCEYLTNTGLASDIQTGMICLSLFSNDNTNPPLMSYYARVEFVDN